MSAKSQNSHQHYKVMKSFAMCNTFRGIDNANIRRKELKIKIETQLCLM